MRFTAAQRHAAWFLLTAPSASVGVKNFLFVFLALPWHPPPSRVRVRVPPCSPQRAFRVTMACI